MEEIIKIASQDRKTQYESLVPQIHALISDEPDLIANMANICAAVKTTFNFLWVGFYLVKGQDLVLGPFQGPVACTRISTGKGVCGQAWEQKTSLIVPDVDQFPGHIACSSESKSEIVIPITACEDVIGVLDIDSDQLNDFSKLDEVYLTKIIDGLKKG